MAALLLTRDFIHTNRIFFNTVKIQLNTIFSFKTQQEKSINFQDIGRLGEGCRFGNCNTLEV